MPLSKFTRLTGVLFASQLLATAAQAGEPIHIGFEGGELVEDIFTFEGYEFASWERAWESPLIEQKKVRAGSFGLVSPSLPSNESASIVLTINAEQGDIISFWLRHQNQFNGSTLSFSINDQQQGSWTPNWDDEPSVWKRHAYTAPSTGELTLRWQVSSPNGSNQSFAIDDIRVYSRNALASEHDVNGDGIDEIFVIQDSGSLETLALENGSFSHQSCGITGNEFSTLGDFNGDGIVEDAFRSSLHENAVTITYLSSDCQATSETARLPTWSLAGAGDFNGDKIDDLLTYDEIEGNVYVQFADHSIANEANLLFTLPSGQEIVSVNDFSGDGIADVLTKDANDLLTLYSVNSNLTHTVHTLFAFNPLLFSAPFADIDGNGTTDIIQFDWFGNIEITFINSLTNWHTEKSRAPFGWLPSTVGDFNGDGISNELIFINLFPWRSGWKDDIASASYFNGTWSNPTSNLFSILDTEYLLPKSDPYFSVDWGDPVPLNQYGMPGQLLFSTSESWSGVHLVGSFNNWTPRALDQLNLFGNNSQTYMGRLSVESETTLAFAIDAHNQFGAACNTSGSEDVTPQPMVGIVNSNTCDPDLVIPWTIPAGDYLVEFAYNQSQDTARAVLRPYTGKTDIDGDGLSDNDEINLYQTDPYDADEDGDQVVDGAEILLFNSNTQSWDSDSDGLDDWHEVELGTSLISADTDNDGLTDIQEINETATDPTNSDTDGDGFSDGVEILRGTSPTFEFEFPRVKFDQNNDGTADILWRNQVTGANWFFGMDHHNVIQSSYMGSLSTDWKLEGRGDFNGDGRSDILWRHVDGTTYIHFMNGTTIQSSLQLGHFPEGWGYVVAGIGDFNGDNIDEILWHYVDSGHVSIYEIHNEESVSSSQVTTISDPDWQINSVADLNGDGKDDIILRHATDGVVWKYIMNGSQITESARVMWASVFWELAVVADFDGDNDADFLWRDTVNGYNYIYLLKQGVVDWQNRGPLSRFKDQQWKAVMAGDFDGDGNEDILWHHFGIGKNYIYFMNGRNYRLKYVNTTSDLNWEPAN